MGTSKPIGKSLEKPAWKYIVFEILCSSVSGAEISHFSFQGMASFTADMHIFMVEIK